MTSPQPKIPTHLDPLAKELLDRLRAYPEAARHVILGGYFALKHYLDYRNTADVDGWWSSDTAPSDQRQEIRRLVEDCIISIDDAWKLWQAKNLGNDNLAEAKRQVIRRMHSIELRRPLESIPKEGRAAVDEARRWVYQELTRQTSEGENVR